MKCDSIMHCDSMLLATDSNVVNRTEFYKVGKTMPDRDVPMSERAYSMASDDYVAGGMLLLFFLFIAVLNMERHVLTYRIKNFFANKRTYNVDSPSETYIGFLGVFMLVFVSAMSITLLYFGYLSEALPFNASLDIPYWLFVAVPLAVLLFMLLKSIVYSIVNWVFFDKESRENWTSSYWLVTVLSSVVLYPVTLVYVFCHDSHEFVTWSVILVAVAYELLLFFKLLVNFKLKLFGYLLIFLYFCTLEVLPALLLCKGIDWITNEIVAENILY